MLVVISDLHLTDGTSPTLNTAAFDLFIDGLRQVAHRASWRTDGAYRPLERIDVVLLGDILDITRSQHWLRSDARPWSDMRSPRVVETITAIVDDILRTNAESATALRSLAAEGAICVAPSSHNGQPVFAAEGIPVAVRTHYVVGNHDWFLHLRGEAFDMLRQKVAHHLGLANPHTMPFPHDPIEYEELHLALRKHRVFARHGDIFDPLAFNEDRDTSSLGDAILVQLVTRFLAHIQRELADDLPPAVLAGLAEVHHIRPLLLIPVWIEGLLDRSCPDPALRNAVKQQWDRHVDDLLQLEMVRERSRRSAFQLVDGLERSLKFSKRLAIGWAEKTLEWLHGLRGGKNESYAQHALTEQEFRNRRARSVVYGHTHQFESQPLDASFADGFVLNQMYFNAGTWRRVYRPTTWTQGQHEFIAAENLSYLAFFQGDERGGRPFETWTGTLGVTTTEAPSRPAPPVLQPAASSRLSGNGRAFVGR